MDNCISSSKKVLKLLNVKFTDEYLKDNILSHQNHPSLLSISDTINKYQIDNLAIRLNDEKLDNIPLPCIAQVSINETTLFYTLKEVNKQEIVFFDDDNKLQRLSRENFVSKWTGVCLLFEKTSQSGEINIDKKLSNKKFFNTLKWSSFLILMAWLIVNIINSEISNDHLFYLYSISYFVLKLVGVGISSMLLWYEVDKYNPTLQNFCSGNKRINCNAVLGSKYSEIFGGLLNLSVLSFSYFFGTLLFLLISSFTYSSFAIAGWLSIIAFPMIILSIYYQAFIIKQWCKFCILIQVIILGEVLITLVSNSIYHDVKLITFPLLGFWLLIPIVSWKIIKPLLMNMKEKSLYKRNLNKIKKDINVFESLLLKSERISQEATGLGIFLGNVSAKYHVLKICNPYCNPCAKSHPILEEMVEKGIIHLQILFTATTNYNDRRIEPVKHFLVIDNQKNERRTRQALDDWYTSDKKEYEKFSLKYPVNEEELNNQKEKIDAMRNWYEKEKIIRTPTLFINGYKLPKEYNIEDLREILI